MKTDTDTHTQRYHKATYWAPYRSQKWPAQQKTVRKRLKLDFTLGYFKNVLT